MGSHAGGSSEGQRRTRTERVAVVSIDDFVRDRGGQVDLMRVSLEGSGLMVHSGMTSIISRDHPDFLFEILPSAPIQEIDRVLAVAGYRFFAIDEDDGRLIALAELTDWSGEGGFTCWSMVRRKSDARSVAEKSGNDILLS